MIFEIFQAITGGALPTPGNVQRNVLGSVILAVLGATVYLGLVMTAWFAADAAYGPVIASAVVTAVLVVIAIIAWAIVAVLNKVARQRAAERQALARARLGNLVSDAAQEAVPAMIRQSPVVTMAAVAGLAYALMKSRAGGR